MESRTARADKWLTVRLAGFPVAEITLLATAAEADFVVDTARLAVTSGGAGSTAGRLMHSHGV